MAVSFGGDLNLEATELRLGLPGTAESEKQRSASVKSNKRGLIDMNKEVESMEEPNLLDAQKCEQQDATTRPSKAQVVGWPPVRSYRKNYFQAKKPEPESAGVYVKVSMDGAPYLRKIDLKTYKGYSELLKDLEDMFKIKVGEYSERQGYKGSEFVPTYEDKDGDWMLVGDVPWNMFITSCKKLRIMKGSEL